jgi:hypothetical protein
MLLHAHAHTIPAAYALLPAAMCSDAATAMLLAIALQESRFEERRQIENGPARGFWQFERGGGVRGVLTHPSTEPHISKVLAALRYGGATTTDCHEAITHNDVLACVFARLLLWSMPGKLPDKHRPEKGWTQYLRGWRPGKPHPETWDGNFGVAWDIVQP